MSASAAHPADAQGHGFEGRVLGGFRMVREIACGGMATVYLAHKAGLGGFAQPAAVKIIHPHLARDREFVEMFLDEARIVSCINHPNVCRVLDFGKAEGTYYLAMEYVMGETWGDVLAQLKGRPDAQSMIPALLAQVLAQACEGLHAAHEARDPEGRPLSIVHRDISPQNLIVGYDGSVRVLDFGIASAAERLHTTRNGTIKGRFAYMAPEQMRGLGVDKRADVWSLGVLLWEGLAQRRLFKRDTEAETVLAVTHDPLPSLADAGHPVPASLTRIVQQALSRERDLRYSTAREMGLELSRFSGSTLVPVGMAEVSIWMRRLFADRIEQKRALMRDAARAAEVDKKPSSIPPPAPLLEVTVDDTSADKPVMGGTLPSISTVREVSRRMTSDGPSRRLVFGPMLGVGAFLCVALVAGLLAPRSGKPATSTANATQHDVHATTAPPIAAEPSPSAPKAAPVPEPVVEVQDLAPAAAPERAEAPPPAQPSTPAPRRAARSNVQSARAISEARAQSEAAAPAKKRVDAPATFGAVNIATPGGWADVYLGAKKLGTTPGRFELPVGSHTLRLRPFGKQPEITRQVDVGTGEAQKLKVSLE